MPAVLYILFATGLTAVTSLFSGRALLRLVLRSREAVLSRSEASFLGAVLGSAILAALAFAMATIGLARRGAFVIAAVLLLAFSAGYLRRKGPPQYASFPEPPKRWKLTFWTIYAIFGGLYLSIALGPEASVDGAVHYLARVALWAREFGFNSVAPAATSGFAHPDGVESLFLFTFALGHHSAAAMVAWLYLMLLPLGVLLYGRRIGHPRAGIVAAVICFTSPVVARTGTIAAPDLALTCVGFALFYCLEMRSADRHSDDPGPAQRWLVPVGILVVFLLWSGIPWAAYEFSKGRSLVTQSEHVWPLEWTIHGFSKEGEPFGLLGPVFLLSPLALLALRWPHGRRLLAWAVLLIIPSLFVPEPRTLIPSLPFVSLALCLAVVAWRGALTMLMAAAAILCWPAVVALSADDQGWYIRRSTWGVALRLRPEEEVLRRSLPGYHAAGFLDQTVPAHERVLALSRFQTAYGTRLVVDGTRGASSHEGKILGDLFRASFSDDEAAPPDLVRRAEAGAALRRSGIRWVLIQAFEHGTHQLFHGSKDWGIKVKWIEENYLLLTLADPGN